VSIIALASEQKSVTSVNIVTSSVIRLTDVMTYMVILLDLWSKQILPHNDPISSNNTGHSVILTAFLEWYEDRQKPSCTASVALSSRSFVGLNHFTSLGPWVLDSGAIDHITSNKSLFSSLSSIGYLPIVTMVDGSKVLSHGVGIVNLFPLPWLMDLRSYLKVWYC